MQELEHARGAAPSCLSFKASRDLVTALGVAGSVNTNGENVLARCGLLPCPYAHGPVASLHFVLSLFFGVRSCAMASKRYVRRNDQCQIVVFNSAVLICVVVVTHTLAWGVSGLGCLACVWSFARAVAIDNANIRSFIPTLCSHRTELFVPSSKCGSETRTQIQSTSVHTLNRITPHHTVPSGKRRRLTGVTISFETKSTGLLEGDNFSTSFDVAFGREGDASVTECVSVSREEPTKVCGAGTIVGKLQLGRSGDDQKAAFAAVSG